MTHVPIPLLVPTPEELEIIRRPITEAEAKDICDTPHLCFEFCGEREWVRCGPCSITKHVREGGSWPLSTRMS